MPQKGQKQEKNNGLNERYVIGKTKAAELLISTAQDLGKSVGHQHHTDRKGSFMQFGSCMGHCDLLYSCVYEPLSALQVRIRTPTRNNIFSGFPHVTRCASPPRSGTPDASAGKPTLLVLVVRPMSHGRRGEGTQGKRRHTCERLFCVPGGDRDDRDASCCASSGFIDREIAPCCESLPRTRQSPSSVCRPGRSAPEHDPSNN